MRRFMSLITALLALWVTSAGAEGPIRLHDEIPAGCVGVRYALISPDSQRVVFVGDLTTPGVDEVYANDVGGGPADTLSQDFSGGGDVNTLSLALHFSPDSSWFYYLADPEATDRQELFAVSPAGGNPPKKISVGINHPAGEVYYDFLPLPDSSGVIYRVDRDYDDNYELFRAYYSGGEFAYQARISPQMPAGRTVSTFKLSPDGTRVVYRADQDSDDVYELYSAPAAGFDPDIGSWQGVKISHALSGGGQTWADFVITPDSSTVIYRADHDGDGVDHAWRVGINGGASTSITPALNDGDGVVAGIKVSPDGAWVVYLVRVDVGQDRLVVVDTATWSIRMATPTMDVGSRVSGFKISPDSRWVAYLADKDTHGSWELWAQRCDGGTPEYKLNPPLAGLDDVQYYQIGANNRVVFTAKAAGESSEQIYAATPGQGSWVNLNRSMVSGGNVQELGEPARFGRLALYRADQATDNALDLWAVPTSGICPPDRLNNPVSPEHRVTSSWVCGDQSRVVYISDYTTLHQYELYSTELPIAGSATGPLLELLR